MSERRWFTGRVLTFSCLVLALAPSAGYRTVYQATATAAVSRRILDIVPSRSSNASCYYVNEADGVRSRTVGRTRGLAPFSDTSSR